MRLSGTQLSDGSIEMLLQGTPLCHMWSALRFDAECHGPLWPFLGQANDAAGHAVQHLHCIYVVWTCHTHVSTDLHMICFRSWLPKLYCKLTAKLKKQLQLSSEGVVRKKRCSKTGKVRVPGTYLACGLWHVFLMIPATLQDRWATAQANTNLPGWVWKSCCSTAYPRRSLRLRMPNSWSLLYVFFTSC